MKPADAKLAGQLCGAAGSAEVVDASVIVVARRRAHMVLTSDPSDLRRLDPRIPLIEV